MIYSRTEWGQMVDFLKAFPFVSKEEYMWEWTVPQIKLASADNTHVRYLSEKQAEMRKATIHDGSGLRNDLGLTVFD